MNRRKLKENCEDLERKDFIARVYKMSKGPNSQCSYFATIKKETASKLSIKEKDALLLGFSNQMFPTVIRKLKTAKNRFMLGFTVLPEIGQKLSYKVKVQFKFLKRSIESKGVNKNDFINLQEIIPSKTIRNYAFYLFDLKDYLLLWIYSKGRVKPCILPKYIPLNKESYNIFEFAGAFFCEGFKARKANNHRDRFSFSNADPEQINWFIETSEKLLHIPKEEWNVQILSFNLNKSKNLINHWVKLGLSKDKIKLIKNNTILAKYGICILNIYNSALAETIYQLMCYAEKESLKSKEMPYISFEDYQEGILESRVEIVQ